MFISRKRFEKEIEKAKNEVSKECDLRKELCDIWDRLADLSEEIDKLKGVKETE
jgi:hypothetical protein